MPLQQPKHSFSLLQSFLQTGVIHDNEFSISLIYVKPVEIRQKTFYLLLMFDFVQFRLLTSECRQKHQ